MMWMCVHCFLSDRTCAVRVLLLYLTVCSQLHCAVSGQSPSNLALNKWTKQSSTYGDYDASKAVDGIIKGPMAFSLTRESPNQWWRVDLGQPSYISRVVLYNRGEAFNGRLAKVSLLVSQSAFTDPSVSSSEWTRVFYRERSFGDVGYINLISLIARHVSVFCGASNGLILREVEIYGSVAENFALKGVASQSTTSDNKFASLAVDGDISTSYASAGAGEHWWNVTLSGAVFTSSVVIYKPETAINSWLVSTTRPQHDPILCSRDTGNTSVIYISCPAFTLAKGLVIKSVGEAGAVVLSEVQVYGFLAPVLNPLMITRQEPGYTSIQFSFRPWNQSLPEHVPPNSYLVYVRQNVSGSTALNQSVNHTSGVSELHVVFNGLVHSTVYEVMITCVVNGTEIQREDTTDVEYLSTRNCSAPVLQTMTIELKRYTNTSTNLTRFRMEVVSAVVEVGCVSLLQHTVTLSGAPEKTIATVNTNNISGEFVNLDPYTNYTVTAVAMNSGDLSSKDERTIQTDVTAGRSTPTPPPSATVPPHAASTDVIVGSVFAVITVIAVVIIVVVCLRHKKLNNPGSQPEEAPLMNLNLTLAVSAADPHSVHSEHRIQNATTAEDGPYEELSSVMKPLNVACQDETFGLTSGRGFSTSTCTSSAPMLETHPYEAISTASEGNDPHVYALLRFNFHRIEEGACSSNAITHHTGH